MKKMAAQVNFCLFLNVFSVWPAMRSPKNWHSCVNIGLPYFLANVREKFLKIYRMDIFRTKIRNINQFFTVLAKFLVLANSLDTMRLYFFQFSNYFDKVMSRLDSVLSVNSHE